MIFMILGCKAKPAASKACIKVVYIDQESGRQMKTMFIIVFQFPCWNQVGFGAGWHKSFSQVDEESSPS